MNHDHPLLGELVAAALSSRIQAYAPYSKFLVGAALLSEDGRIFTGCNVENASYGLTICAERNAVFAAVAAGCRTFTHIVIATDTPQPTPPCGACRQVLFEFSPNLIIGLATPAGLKSRYTLGELLPGAFGPKSLG
jgi:cytidine deaminase